MERIYTAKEAANILGVHYQTLARYCKEGEIPAFKLGKAWRILESDLMHYIERMKDESNGLGNPRSPNTD